MHYHDYVCIRECSLFMWDAGKLELAHGQLHTPLQLTNVCQLPSAMGPQGVVTSWWQLYIYLYWISMQNLVYSCLISRCNMHSGPHWMSGQQYCQAHIAEKQLNIVTSWWQLCIYLYWISMQNLVYSCLISRCNMHSGPHWMSGQQYCQAHIAEKQLNIALPS